MLLHVAICSGTSQNDLDLTYFQHKFLFSYDYFRILKLCGIEIGVHVKICFIKYTCYFDISLIYTPISDIYLFVHVAIATVANN